MEGKGLGLVARMDIASPTLVAYYMCKRYMARYMASSHGVVSDYCVGVDDEGYVMSIFDGSFPPPGPDRIPYVAPLANEPTGVDGQPNAYLKQPTEGGRYELWTMRQVKTGQEIVWDYGPEYGKRPYPSKHNNSVEQRSLMRHSKA
mgnify:CR=1 FL=1